MDKIYLLTNYKGGFGSKHFDQPYRSGLDKTKLKDYFQKKGFNAIYLSFSKVDFSSKSFKDNYVLYTSSEDNQYYYKSFIEDIVYGLELNGAKVIPSFKYLKANNNKVFMEILRTQMVKIGIRQLASFHFGTIEELSQMEDLLTFPCVLKTSEGASGNGVFLAKSYSELIIRARRISRTKNIRSELWDFGRSLKHSGYQRESLYRRKFIVQEFVPDLRNDWKVYIFGKRAYIFYRPILKGRGIKASGGGYPNYLYGQNAAIPEGLLNFTNDIFQILDVPHGSFDIAFDGDTFFLLEYQAVYFGTAGIPYSEGYFENKNGDWVYIKEKVQIEQVYAESIGWYINSR